MRKYYINSDNGMQSDLIEISHVKYAYDTDAHIHDAIEFVYILSGRGEHIIDNRKEIVSRGSLIVINCGQVHSFSITESMEYFNLLFKPAFIDKRMEGSNDFHDVIKYFNYEIEDTNIKNIYFQNGDADKVEEIFVSMLKESISHQYGYINIVRAFLEVLIHKIVRNTLSSYDYKTKQRNEHIDEAIQYIQDNCGTNLTLEGVSNKYSFSANYFSELLKQDTGLTFKQFLIEKRMMKAIQLLLSKEQNYDVETIINKCGYANKSFFYKTFKKHFGVMPKDIKRYRDGHEEYIKEKFLK